MSRFDYVKYDDLAVAQQGLFKKDFEALTELVENLDDGRAKSLVLTKLEEAYMWVGKAIRDNQVERSKIVPLQEERNNS